MKRGKYTLTTKYAAFLYFLITPNAATRMILSTWSKHPALSDYEKPDELVLSIWIAEFASRRNHIIHAGKYRPIGTKQL